MIYQHVARGADQVITSAIDTHVEDEKRKDGAAGAAGRPANGPAVRVADLCGPEIPSTPERCPAAYFLGAR